MAVSALTTRRAAIVGALVSSAALAVPAVAIERDEDAQLVALMEAWTAQYHVANDTKGNDVEDGDIEIARLNAIEAEVAEIVPTTILGFAIKLLVLTNFGEFDTIDGPAACILTDACRVYGKPSPVPSQVHSAA